MQYVMAAYLDFNRKGGIVQKMETLKDVCSCTEPPYDKPQVHLNVPKRFVGLFTPGRSWMTITRKSLSSPIIISSFLERMRRKVRSFSGSRLLTVFLASMVSGRTSSAYLAVETLSKVVLMGIPKSYHICYR